MKILSRVQIREDIDRNRNHSWIQEIYSRHKDELNRQVLYYFGNCITYKTFFEESVNLSRALKANGIKKGDEFIVCIDRIPEFVYLLGAASIIGAKINFISEKFDKNYIKEIIHNANSDIIFVQDNKLDNIMPIASDMENYKVVALSYKRSLPKNNEYQSIIESFYHTDSSILVKECIDYDKFLESGKYFQGDVFEKIDLDDAFTVTYSSGTTKKGMPKAIVHTNRHYITMGRYHDYEASGLPALKNLSTYSNIPVYSNSYISSSLSDNLIEGGKVILDPIDNPEYFLIGAKIHKGNMNIATTSTWLINAINYYDGDKYNINCLPDAMFNFAAGEQVSPGEEKFLNKFFKDTKCGVNITHTPISITKLSTAGADCEHGSIFIRLLRSYFNKAPYRIGRKEPIGMTTYNFVDIQVLREDGTYCEPLEHGRVVANSDCNMKEYNHNPEDTREFWITDAYGKIWGDMKVYGFLDEKKNITMKGRYQTGSDIIPCYRIADEISKDTKKIMSCEVVNLLVDGYNVYVAHIMPQFGTSFNSEKVLRGALQRCINVFGEDIKNTLYFRIRNYKEGYPITNSAKRDCQILKNEGIEKGIHYSSDLISIKKKVKKK